MSNVGRSKVEHDADAVELHAREIEKIAAGVQKFADRMRENGGMPTFIFSYREAMNTYCEALRDWVDGLDAEWTKQFSKFKRSRAESDRIERASKPRGRPRKKRPA